MKKIIYYCDHCGVELKGAGPEEYWGLMQKVDAVLCHDCNAMHEVFEEGMIRMISGLMGKYLKNWKEDMEAYSIDKKFVHTMEVVK